MPVEGKQEDRGRRDHGPESLLDAMQGLFGPTALGEVGEGQHDLGQAPLTVQHGCHPMEDPLDGFPAQRTGCDAALHPIPTPPDRHELVDEGIDGALGDNIEW